MGKRFSYFVLLLISVLILAGCSTSSEPASPLIGTTAPDFTLANTDGGETTLSEYSGTPVLLFFHMAVG